MGLTDFVDRLHPSQRLKTYLGLELWRMYLALLRFSHFFSLS